MTVAKWAPVKDLLDLQDRMNRLFQDSVRGARLEGPENPGPEDWTPLVDIYETENALILWAELPGLHQKDIDIRIEDHTLTLSGERRFEAEVSRESFQRIERVYGKFRRAFTVPPSIDIERIEAHYREGMLKVFIPKLAGSQRKQIKIPVS